VTTLHLLEPERLGAAWAPFAGVRPIAELPAGVWRIRQRWERALGLRAASIRGAHCAGFSEDDEPPVSLAPALRGPAVVAASWFAPTLTPIRLAPKTRRLVHRGEVVGWVLADGSESLPESGSEQEVDGLSLAGTWSLLDARDLLLRTDFESFRRGGSAQLDGAHVFGDPADVVVLGATVEPGVVFDVRNGPVVLDQGVEVRYGTRLDGPTYVGPGTRVLGGEIRGSAIGPVCRVRGEVAESVFLGYANKAHDGFIGHSVVGRWVNVGAGTTTSNLKNTYGTVRLEIGGERIETGRINVGTLFGDHAKTAIGTMLATGTVVGAGASVHGAGMPPRWIPPFSWGLAGTRMNEDGFVTVAERMMARRNVPLTDARRASLLSIYARAAAGGGAG
jgi:UDP-N-acetylglucosamine diphosphorylase / glucose-1-phosphate thymidylyltransferase / UDP-N-acetylgalactosamine diphosphorylase / glucosamine-1-phosphate N-acetyltransferase / galactosamine-1-phosphate N-acetyltransferase